MAIIRLIAICQARLCYAENLVLADLLSEKLYDDYRLTALPNASKGLAARL
jgi:hypothetical protein